MNRRKPSANPLGCAADEIPYAMSITLYEAWLLAGQAEVGGAPESVLGPFWGWLSPKLGQPHDGSLIEGVDLRPISHFVPDPEWSDRTALADIRQVFDLCQFAARVDVGLSERDLLAFADRAIDALNQAIRRRRACLRRALHGRWLRCRHAMTREEFADWAGMRLDMHPTRVLLELELYERFSDAGGSPPASRGQ